MDGANLLVGDQDIGVLHLGFHVVGIGHKIGRDIAFIKGHTVFVFDFDFKTLALLDFDDSVFANQVESFGDFLTNFFVLGADGRNLDPVVFFDVSFDAFEFGHDGLDRTINPPFHEHGVGTGGDI
ncbi:MAG: hypothetical protein ACD_40C00007G0001, partial [uncultured bacterium]